MAIFTVNLVPLLLCRGQTSAVLGLLPRPAELCAVVALPHQLPPTQLPQGKGGLGKACPWVWREEEIGFRVEGPTDTTVTAHCSLLSSFLSVAGISLTCHTEDQSCKPPQALETSPVPEITPLRTERALETIWSHRLISQIRKVWGQRLTVPRRPTEPPPLRLIASSSCLTFILSVYKITSFLNQP